jgi:hypothetical protein
MKYWQALFLSFFAVACVGPRRPVGNDIPLNEAGDTMNRENLVPVVLLEDKKATLVREEATGLRKLSKSEVKISFYVTPAGKIFYDLENLSDDRLPIVLTHFEVVGGPLAYLQPFDKNDRPMDAIFPELYPVPGMMPLQSKFYLEPREIVRVDIPFLGELKSLEEVSRFDWSVWLNGDIRNGVVRLKTSR